MSRDFLGVLAKYPEAGQVKTRLAREIGPERAAAAYRRIADYLFRRTAPAGHDYRRTIFYSPAAKLPQFRDWLPDEDLTLQRGRDVGQRMHNALQDMCERGADKAIVVGADIPGLHRGLIRTAFQRLDDADVVLGPALDGGYYLIGMKALHPGVFRNISWGTGEVFRETLAAINTLGLSFRVVETLFDVDLPADLRRAEEIMKDI